MANDRNWGGLRKGAGAPVTVGAENRRKQRVISLNDKEYELLKEIALERQISISELIRITFNLDTANETADNESE